MHIVILLLKLILVGKHFSIGNIWHAWETILSKGIVFLFQINILGIRLQ